jgi:hypothetical protein
MEMPWHEDLVSWYKYQMSRTLTTPKQSLFWLEGSGDKRPRGGLQLQEYSSRGEVRDRIGTTSH